MVSDPPKANMPTEGNESPVLGINRDFKFRFSLDVLDYLDILSTISTISALLFKSIVKLWNGRHVQQQTYQQNTVQMDVDAY